MKKLIYILLFSILSAVSAQAQEILTDSLYVLPVSPTDPNGDAKIVFTQKKDRAFKPDPVRVLWMGAIIPGYGQILNRSYWKLPIVDAGI